MILASMAGAATASGQTHDVTLMPALGPSGKLRVRGHVDRGATINLRAALLVKASSRWKRVARGTVSRRRFSLTPRRRLAARRTVFRVRLASGRHVVFTSPSAVVARLRPHRRATVTISGFAVRTPSGGTSGPGVA